ncbi:MAG TPA: tRNA 2-thiouridine(34) synthase MnmA [Bacteroidales bacterium]|nr:tRNA 2-thiouridine(34) synthase MnmA [Bacteroidales bacterium]
MAQKVVIGLSGGVDSSVAAWLLKQDGYEVIGLFMINWHDTTGTLYGDCAWKDDLTFAELVARKLDIPLHTVDLSVFYKQRVVDYMFSEYEKGRTPNPDVLCNREIKFDLFVDAAKKYGAEYVATGHYARCEAIETENGQKYRLLAGVDGNKDQSYFLCQLSQKQLSTAMFPIGHITKPEVRQIAESLGLATAQRKDSQGVCFVGKIDLPVFLQQKLKAVEGVVVEIPSDCPVYKEKNNLDLYDTMQPYSYTIDMGKVVGKHSGAHFYTIGQRKGLNIGGMQKPLFVIAIDVVNNIVYVGQGEDHPGLYRKALYVSEHDIHWIRPDLALDEGDEQRFRVRIRYRQPLQDASVLKLENGLAIVFDQAQRGVTPGQFAAWYAEDELVGSGVIAY